MGSRLHVVQGWGMPVTKFKGLADLNFPDCVASDSDYYDLHSEVCNKIKYYKHEFKITKEEHLKIRKQHNQHIFFKGTIQSGDDLFHYICDESNVFGDDYILFYSDPNEKKEWTRYANDLDYTMLVYDNTTKQYDNFNSFCRVHDHGFSYYNLSRTDKNYKPVIFDYNDPDFLANTLPAVPGAIRWWMTKIGLMTDEGVNELRPISAMYWA